MRRLLVIGGDIDAAGPFADALAVIQKGRLREAGIMEIGIAAYPEGHASFPADRMEAALDQKIAAARAAGLQVHIASQFSFSPEAVVGWLKRLRQCGIALPVKVGMAGPTSLTALLRYAKRCGVNASLRGLAVGRRQRAHRQCRAGPDSRRQWLPTASASPARIIFHSAAFCRPPATPAMRQDGSQPTALTHDPGNASVEPRARHRHPTRCAEQARAIRISRAAAVRQP